MVSTGQGASRPYTYRGSAYRRVGNTTLAMSADEYNRMLFERMHSEQRWENQPAAGEGRQAPGQPDEENMKNGQKAVAVTTIDFRPGHAMRRRSPTEWPCGRFYGPLRGFEVKVFP